MVIFPNASLIIEAVAKDEAYATMTHTAMEVRWNSYQQFES